uniref:Uncharacterized protein n=1 Tax=Anopheles minimus TaxID=112268 RepID=A0A182VU64_9DIPT
MQLSNRSGNVTSSYDKDQQTSSPVLALRPCKLKLGSLPCLWSYMHGSITLALTSTGFHAELYESILPVVSSAVMGWNASSDPSLEELFIACVK